MTNPTNDQPLTTLTTTELGKTYDPRGAEQRCTDKWQENNISVPDFSRSESFCIQLPPPNVTGTLHMGHAFNQTIMDALIRHARMSGKNTLWQPGTDHAGIATQMVVTHQLEAQGVDVRAMSREDFLEKVWEWKAYSGNTITNQIKRLGSSTDWSREYFTMDPQMSTAVVEVFVRLFEQGLIYRGKRLVNWDPKLKTAVSDLEVISEEEQGHMWSIAYPFADGSGQLVVATTRPETLFGDVAVMVHPEDARYRSFIGKTVRLPLTDREIPIIADDCVSPEFGTGVVKVTPGHDFNDHQVGKRHQLPLINIFTLDAHLNDQVPLAFQGLERSAARQAVLDALTELGLLVETKPHTLMVPRGDRSGVILEPLLTDQWFVAMSKPAPADTHFPGQSITEVALAAVRQGDIQFVPENWTKTYNQWLDNIQDWCISRQLWWGHQIPAWHGTDGQLFVARDEVQAHAQAKAAGYEGPLTRDPDVLDTWFSSALIPFSALGWPKDTPDLRCFLPSSVLVTGFDIIFFWVARMIMMTLHFTGKVPFKTVYVHGLVRDAEGQKMSKSKGNVLDPIDLIDGIDVQSLLDKRTKGLMRPQDAEKIRKRTEKEFAGGIPAYGADALRFTFAAMATLGRNINFDQKRCEGYRNFCNKLWNATRFVLMNTQDHDCGQDITDPTNLSMSVADLWIVSQLQVLEQEVANGFAMYRFDMVAQSIYQFVWETYCDWYLECAKVQLQSPVIATTLATRYTLVRVLETVLRLIHPITPFISEELWEKVAPLAGKTTTGTCLALQPYPQFNPNRLNSTATQQMQRCMQVIDVIRALRVEKQLSPAEKVELLLLDPHASLTDVLPYIRFLAKASDIQLLTSASEFATKAQNMPTGLIDELQVALLIAIDVKAETARLTKELQRVTQELTKSEQKLQNPAFVDKAPEAVVAQERERLAQWHVLKDKINAQIQQLQQSV